MVKFSLRLTGILFLCGFLFISPDAMAATAASPEELVATPLPDNTLTFRLLASGLEGLEPGLQGRFADQALVPRPQIPGGRSFWNTAENTLFGASLLAFAGMNVADYLLTRESLKYPEAGETNPILRPIVKNAVTFALFKAGYVALSALGLNSLHRNDKPMAWALSIASNVLVALAVSHNINQLNKVKNN
jgi:hypothetical protein